MRLLAALCALLFAAPVLAQDVPSPRRTVGAVAVAVRDGYFDPVKGDRIADELEAEAAAGAFDALTDPRDLATALTGRLSPEDGHFRVIWTAANGPGGAAAGPPGPRPSGGPPPPARANFGFATVRLLPGNLGYVDLRQFAEIDFDDPTDPARRRADAALTLLSGTEAIILDLRENGGGDPSMVGYLVSAFVAPGRDVYNVFHSREGTESEAPKTPHPAPRTDVPVYVLSSGRTGSAAEALAYTLQAADRAVVVGETSAGAANPGGMVRLGGGFGVFVSDGSPRNPITGTNWEKTGVAPDVPTAADAALSAAQLLALDAIVAADPARTDARWAAEALRAGPRSIDLAPYAGAFGPWTLAVEDGVLIARRGGRTSLRLTPLGDDVFGQETDPATRLVFFRDETGTVAGFEVSTPSGPGPRTRRTASP